MKTRIKIVEKSDGSVLYYAQEKSFDSPLWVYIIPIWGWVMFLFDGFWYESDCESLDVAKTTIDEWIEERKTKKAKKDKKTKTKTTYVKYP